MLELYKNRHIGERVVIVCNGPSLNKMDLSFLKNEHVIGLNKIYLGFKKYRFYPKYYVAVNEKVLRQSHQEIKKLTCIKFLSARATEFFSENSLTHIIDTKNPKERFTKDLQKGLEEGWTVTYAALQVAYYLGFTKVIIIGMDHKFSFQGKPNETRFLKGDDSNHFCSTYFANKEWDNPDLENSEKSYQLAKDIFEKGNRQVFDATVNGACNIFDKKNYADIFGLTTPIPNETPLSKDTLIKAPDSVVKKEISIKMEKNDIKIVIDGINIRVNEGDAGGTHYKGKQNVEEAVSPLFNLLKKQLCPSVVIDIGANYGFTASVFYKQLSPKKIIAVEPDPALLDYLESNVKLNVGSDCETKIYPYLVGAKNETKVPFGINPRASQDNRVKPLAGWETKPVDSVTLNKLLDDDVKGENVFIKIDTQGYDPVVIQSGEDYLCRHNNWVIRSEFAPQWMVSQEQDAVSFLCYATQKYDVYEAPARVPYFSTLKNLFSNRIPNDKEKIKDFVTYVESLNHNKKGWVEVFIFPKNSTYLK